MTRHALRRLLPLAVLVAAPSIAGATTFTVTDCNDTVPGGGPGQLRRLMNDAGPGDTIVIPACTILLNGAQGDDANATGDLDLLKNLTLEGSGDSTIVDGSSIENVFQVHTGVTASLTGLVIRNGDFPGSGGGIRNRGTLFLTSVAVVENTAVHGGGLSNNGTATIVGSVFAINGVGGAGGGIENLGSLTIVDSFVAQNTANSGGGGIVSVGPLVVRDSAIFNNHNQSGVGGGLATYAAATVERSELSGNFSESAGGIFNRDVLTLVNSTISGNSASGLFGSGGGLYNATEGNATLESVTLTLNGAGMGGGSGIRNQGTTTLRHTIVSANDCLGPIISAGHNLDGGTTCALSGPGDLSGTNPMLGPLTDNGGPTFTHELLPGSPALDAGDLLQCPATDQRGTSRPQGVGCDMGSYERIAPTPIFVSTANCTATEATPPSSCVFDISLSVAGTEPVTVQFASSDGTAVAGADYVAASGTVTFPPGLTVQPVAVTIIDDVIDEPDEAFTLTLSSPTNALILDGQGSGGITDDDQLPSLSVEACAVLEGQAGTVACDASVVLSPPSSFTVTVSFATANLTATAGSDYVATSGIVTFPPGTTTRPLPVTVNGDVLVEGDEIFLLNLQAPINATLLNSQASNTIGDDDAPALSSRELAHGSTVHDDLQGGPDLFRIGQAPRASYEVTVDATSGDMVPVELERLAGDNSTVLQSGDPVGSGPSVTLRWENTTSLFVTNQHIRVDGPCAASCGNDDVYRIRAVETTYSIPRFNNSGSQLTVLILQNPGTGFVRGSAWFWSGGGTLLARRPFELDARQTLVLNTAPMSGVSGQSGTITVTSDAPYGGLVGKTVALEPSTGFAFDTPMAPRPR